MNIDESYIAGLVPKEIIQVLKDVPLDFDFVKRMDDILPDDTSLEIEIDSRIDRSECSVRFMDNRFSLWQHQGIHLKLRHDGIFMPISYYA